MSDQIDELEKLLVDGKSIDPTKLRPRLMKGGVYGYEIEANELKAFLSHIEAYTLEQSRKAVVETEKAFGGCKKCYGKGYATVRSGIRGFDDFGGEGFVGAIKTNMKFCTCDRGKQLAKITKQEL